MRIIPAIEMKVLGSSVIGRRRLTSTKTWMNLILSSTSMKPDMQKTWCYHLHLPMPDNLLSTSNNVMYSSYCPAPVVQFSQFTV